MSCSNTHTHPEHVHGPGCGHTAIHHNGHTDYIVDGVLHHPHGNHCDEHVLTIDGHNPNECNSAHSCGEHVHGPDCGHEAIQHGDHIDYIVNGRLHHQHGDHCDDHGPVEIVSG